MKKLSSLLVLVLVASFVAACPAPTPQVIEVPKEVVVEKKVVETVEVVKEVAVEKVVKETVVVEKIVEVEKEVEKLVFVTPTPEPIPSEPVQGGTLRVTYFQPFHGLDPQAIGGSTVWVIGQQVWDTLVDWDPDLNVVPSLAESWEISEDAKTFTFYLRKGVLFNNGKELKAEDVVYSLQRCANPEVGFSASYLKQMDTVEAVDDYTVKITLSEPYVPFLFMLGWFNFPIYPKDHVPSDEAGWIGTGPFTIESYIPQEQVIFAKNPNHWREGMPYLDRIELNVIRDDLAKVAALLSDQSDLIYWIAPLAVKSLDGNPDLTAFVGPAQIHKGIAVNTFKEPFDDPLVREAFNVAINRKQMFEVCLEGYGSYILGDAQLPTAWAYYDKEFVPAEGDLDKAKALLEEAGYPDGFTTTICTFGTSGADIKAAQIIQASVKDIGIDLQIQNVDPGMWVEKVYAGECELAFQGLRGYHPDQYLRQTVHPTEANVKPMWDNQAIADMIEAAATELDQDKRMQMYYDLQEALHAHGEDTYTVFLELWRDTQRAVLSNRVHGFYNDGTGTFRSLKQVWVEE